MNVDQHQGKDEAKYGTRRSSSSFHHEQNDGRRDQRPDACSRLSVVEAVENRSPGQPSELPIQAKSA
jgi:hypothetical protein